ncbi:MAG TPA: serine/threonine-protein kinase [Actinomycetota bacterium]|nr:serine/threonine-protein kinase [Actinomycetota bacterium]
MAAKQPGDPRRLGPYELVGRLGQGGMGVVFLGRERRGRLVAVKALRPELAGDPAFAARFRREVDAARRVVSPHVARVLDADPSADRPWLATEYVNGSTLATEVAITGPLAGGRLLTFATRVAQALTAIHAAGVVHRDLKPTNVLLEQVQGPPEPATIPLPHLHPDAPEPQPPVPGPPEGERSGPTRGAPRAVHNPPGTVPDRFGVKVIDFGIAWAAGATVTRSGLRFGTPSWMAPEQLRDQPAGPPTDVFAWGALVAFAATGRHPFGGGPPDAVAYRILHGRPDLDGVPEAMRQLVREALARDPAARPTADRVVAILAAASPPTRPLPAGDPTWVLPTPGGGSDRSASTDVPRAMAAGPTRRRRRRRVGRLLVAAALLAGLVTAPHVVLAAVEGPSDSPSQHQHPSKQCPGDDEDGWAAEDDRDHEPDEGLEEDDEEEDEGGRGEKEGEAMEEIEDQEDPEDRKPGRAGGQIGLEWPPAANPQPPPPPQQLPLPGQPPATHEPAGDPVLGS